jgi:hypothetical protein
MKRLWGGRNQRKQLDGTGSLDEEGSKEGGDENSGQQTANRMGFLGLNSMSVPSTPSGVFLSSASRPTSAPQTSAIHGGENGASTADQRFLAELAIILSEEEEQKKRQEREKQQQQQTSSAADDDDGEKAKEEVLQIMSPVKEEPEGGSISDWWDQQSSPIRLDGSSGGTSALHNGGDAEASSDSQGKGISEADDEVRDSPRKSFNENPHQSNADIIYSPSADHDIEEETGPFIGMTQEQRDFQKMASSISDDDDDFLKENASKETMANTSMSPAPGKADYPEAESHVDETKTQSAADTSGTDISFGRDNPTSFLDQFLDTDDSARVDQDVSVEETMSELLKTSPAVSFADLSGDRGMTPNTDLSKSNDHGEPSQELSTQIEPEMQQAASLYGDNNAMKEAAESGVIGSEKKDGNENVVGLDSNVSPVVDGSTELVASPNPKGSETNHGTGQENDEADQAATAQEDDHIDDAVVNDAREDIAKSCVDPKVEPALSKESLNVGDTPELDSDYKTSNRQQSAPESIETVSVEQETTTLDTEKKEGCNSSEQSDGASGIYQLKELENEDSSGPMKLTHQADSDVQEALDCDGQNGQSAQEGSKPISVEQETSNLDAEKEGSNSTEYSACVTGTEQPKKLENDDSSEPMKSTQQADSEVQKSTDCSGQNEQSAQEECKPISVEQKASTLDTEKEDSSSSEDSVGVSGTDQRAGLENEDSIGPLKSTQQADSGVQEATDCDAQNGLVETCDNSAGDMACALLHAGRAPFQHDKSEPSRFSQGEDVGKGQMDSAQQQSPDLVSATNVSLDTTALPQQMQLEIGKEHGDQVPALQNGEPRDNQYPKDRQCSNKLADTAKLKNRQIAADMTNDVVASAEESKSSGKHNVIDGHNDHQNSFDVDGIGSVVETVGGEGPTIKESSQASTTEGNEGSEKSSGEPAISSAGNAAVAAVDLPDLAASVDISTTKTQSASPGEPVAEASSLSDQGSEDSETDIQYTKHHEHAPTENLTKIVNGLPTEEKKLFEYAKAEAKISEAADRSTDLDHGGDAPEETEAGLEAGKTNSLENPSTGKPISISENEDTQCSEDIMVSVMHREAPVHLRYGDAASPCDGDDLVGSDTGAAASPARGSGAETSGGGEASNDAQVDASGNKWESTNQNAAFASFHKPEPFDWSEIRTPEVLKEAVNRDALVDEFRDLRHSFQRLFSATSSTAATVSDVTVPVLAEAGIAVASSATGLADTCRREIDRRRSERNLIVSFVQDNATQSSFPSSSSKGDGDVDMSEHDDPVVQSIAKVLSKDDIEAPDLPGGLALASGTNLDQYRTEVSRFLGEGSSHGNQSDALSASMHTHEQKDLEGAAEVCTDPVLGAAVAGAMARKMRNKQRTEKRLGFGFGVNNEWTASLNRLANYTASATASVVAVTAPALKEAKGVAAQITQQSVSGERYEEEIVVLGKSARDDAYVKRGGEQKVYAAQGVSFEKAPKSLAADTLVTETATQLSSAHPGERSCFSVGSRLHETGTPSTPVRTSACHSTSRVFDESVPGSSFVKPQSMGSLGVSSPRLKDGARTPGSIARWSTASGLTNPSMAARPRQSQRQTQNDALKNPKRFMEFLSKKLQAHVALEHGVSSRDQEKGSILAARNVFDARRSVFADERKSKESSSISSPASPGELSLSSSSSDNDSQENSMSTSSFVLNQSLAAPAVTLWDMMSENQLNIMPPAEPDEQSISDGQYNDTEQNLQAAKNLSFVGEGWRSQDDMRVADRSEVHAMETHDESLGESESEHMDRSAMETHIEHPDESERSDLMIDSPASIHKNSIDATSEALATPEDGHNLPREAEGPNRIGLHDCDEPIHATPPAKPSDTMDLASFSWQSNGSSSTLSRKNYPSAGSTKRPSSSIANKRRRQSEKRLEHVLSVRTVKSTDYDYDENDSTSLAGYMSLPSTHGTGNELFVTGTKSTKLLDEAVTSPQSSVNWTTSSLTGSKSSFSASKRGPAYSARKRSSRRRSSVKKNAQRLPGDHSTNVFPSLKEIKSGELLVGLRNSVSENDLLLLPRNDSEPSISFQNGLSPDFDDLSGVEEGGGMLELALMTFSSTANSTLLDEMTKCAVLEPLRYLASVRWRQIVSYWKHNTLANALTERPCSSHYSRDDEGNDLSNEEESFMSSTCAARIKPEALELFSAHQQNIMIHPETKNLNGLMPHLGDGQILALSEFITEFGAQGINEKVHGDATKLAHILPEGTEKITVSALLDLAASNLKQFASLLENIVQFASHNYATSDGSEAEVSFSFGIKSREAIEKKAGRKYSGDILQVKDILRGQIIFGDEGSLVAGLLSLYKFCGRSEEIEKVGFSVQVVRVKNYFQKSASGTLRPSLLPTGYRHILVNLRLNDLMIAGKSRPRQPFLTRKGTHAHLASVTYYCVEIQLQLAELFDVLGYDGYNLHREILEVEEACVLSYRTTSAPARGKDSVRENRTSQLKARDAAAEGTGKTTEKQLPSVDGPTKAQSAKISNNSLSKTTVPAERAPAKESSSMSNEGGNARRTEEETETAAATGKVASSVKQIDVAADIAGSEHGSASLHPFDDMNGSDNLGLLRTEASVYSREHVLSAIRSYAMEMAASNPRDIPTFYCLHFLVVVEGGFFSNKSSTLSDFLGNVADLSIWPLFAPRDFVPTSTKQDNEKARGQPSPDSSKILSLSKECLLRCLSIANQGTSVGMTGWLEYGAGTSFGRIAGRPFETLHQLACSFAWSNDWKGAIDVLGSLVARCEQHLPLYHPTTISAMLDLAGAAKIVANHVLERKMLGCVVERLVFYLSEKERFFFTRYGISSKTATSDAVVVRRFDNGIDGISMLRSFVEVLERNLSRDFLHVLEEVYKGGSVDIKLVNHCLLADALSVTANCVSVSETLFGSSRDSSARSRCYWQWAYKHYETAFKGWTNNNRSSSDENVVSAAYGLARCLRELGKRHVSVQILSSVVSALDSRDKGPAKDHQKAYGQEEGGAINQKDDVHYGAPSISFLPHRKTASVGFFSAENRQGRGKREISMALCLWLMSVLSVEENPNERGRVRALSLLHAASETLQNVLSDKAEALHAQSTMDPNDDDSYQRPFHEIMLRIEQEAKDLLEPFQETAPTTIPKEPAASSEVSKHQQWPFWQLRDDQSGVSA